MVVHACAGTLLVPSTSYFNHVINPNAILSPPKYVRRKWRVGFLAAKGDEVVWDYGVHNEVEWGMCKMVEGLVVDDRDARMEGKVRVVSVTQTIQPLQLSGYCR